MNDNNAELPSKRGGEFALGCAYQPSFSVDTVEFTAYDLEPIFAAGGQPRTPGTINRILDKLVEQGFLDDAGGKFNETQGARRKSRTISDAGIDYVLRDDKTYGF